MRIAKISILVFTTFFATHCLAQDEATSGTHFGVKAGINIANVTIKAGSVSISPSSLIGLNAGFFATLPVGKSIAIQPELTYSGLGYKSDGDKATLNYLTLPVLVKYTFESTGFGAYVGPQIGYLLSAKATSGGTTEDFKDQVKSTDFAGIVGVEYTFPMGFNVSARYQLGFSNIAKDTNGEGSIKNHAATFTIGYRFK